MRALPPDVRLWSLGVKSVLSLLPPAGADFTGISDVWTFSDTVSMRCVTVSALDDDILEGNQTFFVNLTTSNTDVILNPAAAEVTITDVGTLTLIS